MPHKASVPPEVLGCCKERVNPPEDLLLTYILAYATSLLNRHGVPRKSQILGSVNYAQAEQCRSFELG